MLEARHAAFLTFLHIPFTYETHKCYFGRYTYTIDFSLPKVGPRQRAAFLEIKPRRPGAHQYAKAAAFSNAFPDALVVLLYGAVCNGFSQDANADLRYNFSRGLVGIGWLGGKRLAGDVFWGAEVNGTPDLFIANDTNPSQCSLFARHPTIDAAFKAAQNMRIERLSP